MASQMVKSNSQKAKYISPGKFAEKSEKIQGSIRTNNLAVLEEKYKQSRNLLTAEQIKTDASRLKITQAHNLRAKEAYTAQKLGYEAQTAAVGANTSAVNLRTAQINNLKAQIDLGAAQVETRLHGMQKQAKITGKALDLSNIMSQNAEKSALLAMQGRLQGLKKVN